MERNDAKRLLRGWQISHDTMPRGRLRDRRKPISSTAAPVAAEYASNGRLIVPALLIPVMVNSIGQRKDINPCTCPTPSAAWKGYRSPGRSRREAARLDRALHSSCRSQNLPARSVGRQ
jgi:hypothetical protein